MTDTAAGFEKASRSGREAFSSTGCLSGRAWRLRGIAVGEESIGYNLRCLPTRCVVERPEVRPVVGWDARLAGTTAVVALHDTA